MTLRSFTGNSLQDISVEEFGEEAAKIKTIIDECLQPVESRPEMHIALDSLRVPLTLHQKGMGLHSEATGSSHTGTLSSRRAFQSHLG